MLILLLAPPFTHSHTHTRTRTQTHKHTHTRTHAHARWPADTRGGHPRLPAPPQHTRPATVAGGYGEGTSHDRGFTGSCAPARRGGGRGGARRRGCCNDSGRREGRQPYTADGSYGGDGVPWTGECASFRDRSSSSGDFRRCRDGRGGTGWSWAVSGQ